MKLTITYTIGVKFEKLEQASLNQGKLHVTYI